MKKLLTMFCALAMMVALAGCGAQPAGNDEAAAGTDTKAASDVTYVKDKGEMVIGYTVYEPMNYTDAELNIVEFEEKPAEPKSNLASMGVYCFSWEVLRKYLIEDENDPDSDNDFGKNIIPKMLGDGLKLAAHRFDGYWKDVGTIQSLWEANMELLDDEAGFRLADDDWKFYSRNPIKPPHYIAPEAKLKNCYITEGCEIYGEVEHSVIFEGVTVEEGAKIKDSIIFPGAVIKKDAIITKAMIGTNTEIGVDATIGSTDDSADMKWVNEKICSDDITLIGPEIKVADEVKIAVNSMVTEDIHG